MYHGDYCDEYTHHSMPSPLIVRLMYLCVLRIVVTMGRLSVSCVQLRDPDLV